MLDHAKVVVPDSSRERGIGRNAHATQQDMYSANGKTLVGDCFTYEQISRVRTARHLSSSRCDLERIREAREDAIRRNNDVTRIQM